MDFGVHTFYQGVATSVFENEFKEFFDCWVVFFVNMSKMINIQLTILYQLVYLALCKNKFISEMQF